MTHWALLVSASVATFFGCTGREQTAVGLYESRCADCHGTDGHASGRVARALPHRPTSFGNKHWAKSVSRDYVRTVILTGGAGVGLSPLMPSNQDLVAQPQLVEQLVDYLLKLSTKPKG